MTPRWLYFLLALALLTGFGFGFGWSVRPVPCVETWTRAAPGQTGRCPAGGWVVSVGELVVYRCER